MMTREDKRMVKTALFWCMVIPLGPHSVYTLWSSRGFVNCSFKKPDHRKGHLPWPDFMVHVVNRP